MKVRDVWPNRHTEECSDCGARQKEIHEECGGHLGTGIRNVRAARRYLRRKWSEGRPEPIAYRPGARFYVTGARAFLLGPYVSHMTALAAVPRGRRLAAASGGMTVEFGAYGTASCPDAIPTRYGR